MASYNKILAVVDPSSEEQKSISRAIEIAEKAKTQVTALLCIYDFSYEMTTMLSADERETMRSAMINERTRWLSDVVANIPSADRVDLDIKVVWHNRPFESIIYEVIDHQYDLIVKGTHLHSTLKSIIFTPTDWHLLRKAPASVLLVKDHAWPANGNVLAAINVGTEDSDHQSLNTIVSEHAAYFTELLDANLHFVNSYPGTPVNIAVEMPEFDPRNYNNTVKDYHVDAMQEHAETYNVHESQCHVKEGLTEDVISQVASNIDAELVVIGTVGRQGISAALIGNTAEHVIDIITCDLLALKPDGFKSPLEL
ncbi:universal stress protein UspE [Alteromonadaceae bacterium M269]|nr:universal stress protein UspE [Alteromonadaceae bacterium M269]